MGSSQSQSAKKTRQIPPNIHVAIIITAILVMAGLFLFALYLSQFFGYTMDDAFITFRYARNFANGLGLVFNPNEYPRAEGITSPLYALGLSIPIYLRMDVVVLSKVIGITSMLVSCIAIFAITRRLARVMTDLPSSHVLIIASLGILVFLSDPYLAGNAVSGMETALSVLTCMLFTLYFVTIITRKTDARGYASGVFAVLGVAVSLLRPELTVFVMSVFILALWLIPPQRRFVFVALVVFCGLGVIYFIGRYLYYELPLPLPFYVKQGAFKLSGLRDTISYFRHILFLFPALAFLVGGVGRAYQNKESLRWVLPAILIVAVFFQGAYYLTLQHIMGMGFRFFQPIHAIIITFVGAGLAIAWQHCQKWTGVGKYLAVTALIMLMAGAVFWNIGYYRSASVIYKDLNAKAVSKAIQTGQKMQIASQGNQLVMALNDCGAIPFYTNFTTIDLAGLNNRSIALNPASDNVLQEIAKNDADIVILVSNANHGLASLRGYEGISSEQVLHLGFRYLGSVKINPTYFLLVFGKSTPQVDDFTKRLVDLDVMELAPAD